MDKEGAEGKQKVFELIEKKKKEHKKVGGLSLKKYLYGVGNL